jgi:hypothetical protein
MVKSYETEDESCDTNFLIGKGKYQVRQKRSSDKSCKNYKVNKCNLPDSVFYYADDRGHVPKDLKSEYKSYRFRNIVRKLDKIKNHDKLNEKRCECDYMVSLNWSSKDGTSLWDKYKKYGFWKKGDGINDYLDNRGVDEKLKYEIMKLLCDATNTTNPRPNSYKSPKSFFDSQKTLQITNIIMGLLSTIIIVMATGTYKKYIAKLSKNNISFGIFSFIILAIAILLIVMEFFTTLGEDILKSIFNIYFPIILVLILFIIYKVSENSFRYIAVLYLSFLIGIQLWLSLPIKSITHLFGKPNHDTSGILELLAIIIEKTGIINKGLGAILGNSIKTTSGSKWNVPFVPATIMIINWILGVNMTESDLVANYTKKMKKIKASDPNSYQIDPLIGDIGF